jgi:hypothetical protein
MIVFWSEGHPPEDCDPGSDAGWRASGVVHYTVEPTEWKAL